MSRDAGLYEFRFPDIGEGLTEGTVVELKVAPGQKVKAGDPLAIVETDKVVTEMPSPVEGVVVEMSLVKGQVVKVGEIVAWIRTSAAPAPATSAATVPVAAPGGAQARETPHVESGTVVGRIT